MYDMFVRVGYKNRGKEVVETGKTQEAVFHWFVLVIWM
jgi:hypothetical protein